MSVRAVVSAAVLAALLLPELADAHAVLLRASPPRRAVLRDPPKQIQLWFNERLEPAYASVTVTQNGVPVTSGKTIVDAQDARRLTLPLPPLAPGDYRVHFRVLSVDGHVAEESFGFTVGR